MDSCPICGAQVRQEPDYVNAQTGVSTPLWTCSADSGHYFQWRARHTTVVEPRGLTARVARLVDLYRRNGASYRKIGPMQFRHLPETAWPAWAQGATRQHSAQRGINQLSLWTWAEQRRSAGASAEALADD